jgi:hypothetical protein
MFAVPGGAEFVAKRRGVVGIEYEERLAATRSSGKEDAIASEDIAETKSGSEEDH